ncbi:unnamed protein product [Paramecium primaurelia]|uniref:Uncharacterized protein n=1 Tax=Paramecium primaurelia TaxID=5886 RepID=A0A8S1JQN3_PARPR|nr:unnamed protein product [Paramecium primaurelia]
MYSISEFSEFQSKIVHFQSKLTDNDKNNFQFCYNIYKKLKQQIKQAQQYFSKFNFLLEFYDLLEEFQRDKQIQEYMKCYYYLLPIIFNNQIYSGILESTQFQEQEVQKLLNLTNKLKSLELTEQIDKDFKNPEELKLKSSLSRHSISYHNKQQICKIPYQLCYQYFYSFHLKFQQNGLYICYQNYNKLKMALNKIKELFIQERKLYKLMELNVKNLKAQKIPKLKLIDLNVNSKQIQQNFNDKINLLQFDNFEIQYLQQFSVYAQSIINHNFEKKDHFGLSKISVSHNNQLQITSRGDDYQIQLELKDIMKNEIIYQLKQNNRGLIDIQFSENSKYFYLLQSFIFKLYDIVSKSELLNLHIDLEYQEERFLNAQLYSNDTKLILLSDLQIKLFSFNGFQFLLEQIFNIYNISLINKIQIIESENSKDKIIEIKGKLSTTNSIYLQINDDNYKLIQFYIL